MSRPRRRVPVAGRFGSTEPRTLTVGKAHEVRTSLEGPGRRPVLELRHRPEGGDSNPWPAVSIDERRLRRVLAAEVVRRREQGSWWSAGRPDFGTVLGKGVSLEPPLARRLDTPPRRVSPRWLQLVHGEEVADPPGLEGVVRCRRTVFTLLEPDPRGDLTVVHERLPSGLDLDFDDGLRVRLAVDSLRITSNAGDEVPVKEVPVQGIPVQGIPVEGILDHLLTIWRHLLEGRDRSDERAPEG